MRKHFIKEMFANPNFTRKNDMINFKCTRKCSEKSSFSKIFLPCDSRRCNIVF